MSKGSAEGLVYFDGAKGFDTSLASLESNWIQTGWMIGWITQCVKNSLSQWFSTELAESYCWYSLGADIGASVV